MAATPCLVYRCGMYDEKSWSIARFLLAQDMLLTAVAFVSAQQFREILIPYDSADFVLHISLLPLFLAFLGFWLTHFGAYTLDRARSLRSFAWSLVRALVLSMAGLLVLVFMVKVPDVSRLVMLLFAVFDVLLLLAGRILFSAWCARKLRRPGPGRNKVLIIGVGERAQRLTRALRSNPDASNDIIGYIDTDAAMVGRDIHGVPVLGVVDDIGPVLTRHVVDEVVLAIPRTMIKDVEAIAYACEEQGVKFRLMADVFDLHVARMRLVRVEDIPLLTFEPVAQNETELIVKRMADVMVPLLFMPVLLPLLGVVALAIKVDSPGPVFFAQNRVGLRKRVFRMYKFRSMQVGADERQKELEHLNEAQGPIFKISSDPRVTRVGRFLRKTSLDELPQLINVIKGDMSLVGPRPMSLRDVGLFDRAIQRKRFSVKPGITCLWQISGRSELPFEKWLELDLRYIEHWSLGLDMKILLRTIPAVLRGSGAV